MRWLVTAVIVTNLGLASVAQSTRRSGNNFAEELSAIEHGLAVAYVKGDRDYVNRALADDWRVVDAAGAILDKAQVLRESFDSKERQIDSAEIDQIQVRTFGECAVVIGRSRFSGRYRGTSVSAAFRFTDVFVRIGGRWRVVSSQASLLTQ